MFVSIDDKLYSKCLINCEKYKFKKTTLHYVDSQKNKKKVKVVSVNDKLFIYDPTKIISKLIIPKSKLLETICEMINSIVII